MGQENQEQRKKERIPVVLQDLPNDGFLLVRTNRAATIIPMDEYPSMDDRRKLYLDAMRNYGEENVRFCKVLQTKVQHTVEILE